MKTKFFAVIAFIFFLFSFSMAEADYTSWQDSSYDFKAVKTVYIGSMDTSEAGISSSAVEMKVKDNFYKKAMKIRGPAMVAESPETMEVEPIEKGSSSTEESTSMVPEEAVKAGADLYIYPKLTVWQVDSYLVPAHTEWRDTMVRDFWRDKDGYWHEFYRTVTYPEYIPSYYVPCAGVAVTFEWYDVKTGKLVASSEDSRLRGSESNPQAVYERIVDRFCKNAKNTFQGKA